MARQNLLTFSFFYIEYHVQKKAKGRQEEGRDDVMEGVRKEAGFRDASTSLTIKNGIKNIVTVGYVPYYRRTCAVMIAL